MRKRRSLSLTLATGLLTGLTLTGFAESKAAERVEFTLHFSGVKGASSYQIQFLKKKPAADRPVAAEIHDFKGTTFRTIISSEYRFFRIRAVGRHKVPGLWSAVHGTERYVKRTRGAFRRIEARGDRPTTLYLVRHRLALNAVDLGAGVGTIRYRLNGGSWQDYKSPLRFERDGRYTLMWYATDSVGNREQSQSVAFVVDRTPPKLKTWFSKRTVRARGRLWSAPGNALNLRAHDSGSGLKGVFCRVLGRDGPTPSFDRCANRIDLAGLRAGNTPRVFIIEVFAEDRLGNRTRVRRIQVRKKAERST